jgi:hypothetical protein
VDEVQHHEDDFNRRAATVIVIGDWPMLMNAKLQLLLADALEIEPDTIEVRQHFPKEFFMVFANQQDQDRFIQFSPSQF